MLRTLRQTLITDRMKIFRQLAVLLCILLCACQAMHASESEKKLRNTLRVYEDVVRWGRLQKIYLLTQPKPGVKVEIPDGLDNVRVMGYEVVSGPTQVNEERWTQTVLIEYVKTDQQVVKSLGDNQVWALNPTTGDWFRENPIPRFD